jgi:hypothetical protein
MIEMGADRNAAIQQYMLRWGITGGQADRLYNDARRMHFARLRQKTLPDIVGGVAIIALAGVLGWLPNVGAPAALMYAIFWLVLAGGAAWLARGLRRRALASEDAGPVWAFGTVVGVGALVLIGVSTAAWSGFDFPSTNLTSYADPTPSATPKPAGNPDDVQWQPDEGDFGRAGWLRLTGSITNNSTEWAVFAPRLEVVFYDKDDTLISRRYRQLRFTPIQPGETYHYSEVTAWAPHYARYEAELLWDWERAE